MYDKIYPRVMTKGDSRLYSLLMSVENMEGDANGRRPTGFDAKIE